jgi:hypothetical protein
MANENNTPPVVGGSQKYAGDPVRGDLHRF